MSHVNVITLTGVVHEDPKSKTTQSGSTVAKFTLINEEGYGDMKHTNWFRCVAYGKTAEFVVKYIKNRSNISVVGKCSLKKYQEKFYTEITAKEVEFNGAPVKDGGVPKKDQSPVPDFEDCQQPDLDY